MDSYRTRGDTELDYTGSTQTLGVKSSSSTASFAKDGRKVRSGLIFICVLLLLVCIALAAYLIVTAIKQDGSETDAETCKKTKTDQRVWRLQVQ